MHQGGRRRLGATFQSWKENLKRAIAETADEELDAIPESAAAPHMPPFGTTWKILKQTFPAVRFALGAGMSVQAQNRLTFEDPKGLGFRV